MSNNFNPYLRWFDIPLEAQPPNHYALLGLDLYESDAAAIEHATEQRLVFLQDVANGPYTKESQRLLNEVAAARLCLTDASKKAAYDQRLQQRLANPLAAEQPLSIQRTVAAEQAQQTDATDLPAGVNPGLNIQIHEKAASPSLNQLLTPRKTVAKKIAAKARQSKSSPFAKPIFVRNLLIGGAAVSVLITIIAIAIFFSGLGDQSSSSKKSDASDLSVGRFDGNGKPASANLASTRSQSDTPFVQSKFASGSSGNRARNKSIAPVSQNDITRDGLVIWLDADDGATLELNQGRVKNWKDKSQQQHNAVQDKSESQPQFQADAMRGKPAVILGKPAYLSLKSTESLNLGDNFTIAMVAWSNKGDLMSKGLPHKQDTPSAFSLLNGASRFRTTKTKYMTAVDDDPAEWKVRIAVAEQKSFSWYIDGLNECLSTEPHTISNPSPLVIGRRLDDSSPSYATGALSELLIYNRPLSDAERQQLEYYLTQKWFE